MIRIILQIWHVPMVRQKVTVLNNPVSLPCLETTIGGLWLYLETDDSTVADKIGS